ncbi:MAG: hypothetical protein ACK5OX_18805 [Desertimonas sp.]
MVVVGQGHVGLAVVGGEVGVGDLSPHGPDGMNNASSGGTCIDASIV